MTAQRKNLVADKGATFDQSFRYKDSEGTPVNLIGDTVVFTIHEIGEETPLFSYAAVVTADGWINLTIEDEDTATWVPNRYAYRLTRNLADGSIKRLLFGTFDVRSGVDV